MGLWGLGRLGLLPIVSIVVPFFGLTNSIYILRILKGNPKKEPQWRL